MVNDWNQMLGADAETKEWEDISNSKQEEIEGLVEEHRSRFEQEFKESSCPKHPYKIMMEIRKEKGLYGSKSHDDPELLRALDILKEEYEERWGEMANA